MKRKCRNNEKGDEKESRKWPSSFRHIAAQIYSAKPVVCSLPDFFNREHEVTPAFPSSQVTHAEQFSHRRFDVQQL